MVVSITGNPGAGLELLWRNEKSRLEGSMAVVRVLEERFGLSAGVRSEQRAVPNKVCDPCPNKIDKRGKVIDPRFSVT